MSWSPHPRLLIFNQMSKFRKIWWFHHAVENVIYFTNYGTPENFRRCPQNVHDTQCTYKRSIKARSRHNFCCGTAISITYWVCLQSLLYSMQCACAILYCHLWPVQLLHKFFPHYSTRHDFREYVTEHKMCLLISSTTFIWNISHSKKKSVRYQCGYVLM